MLLEVHESNQSNTSKRLLNIKGLVERTNDDMLWHNILTCKTCIYCAIELPVLQDYLLHNILKEHEKFKLGTGTAYKHQKMEGSPGQNGIMKPPLRFI